jgi:NAD-dependent deacetylase
MRCGRAYSAEFVKQSKGVPRCTCGGIVKPDVVLYEESLDSDVMYRAARAIADADVLIVGGTSLTVYPAAGMIGYYRGRRLVLINRDRTPYDGEANLVIHDSLGTVFSRFLHENE